MIFFYILLLLITCNGTAQQKTITNTTPRILTFVCPYPLPMQRPTSVELDDTDSDISDDEPRSNVSNTQTTNKAQDIRQSIHNKNG